MEGINVFVSCCSIKPQFSSILYILKMMDFADRHGIKCQLFPRLDESLICRARNRALADFYYQPEYTHLMTVDDDLIFPEKTIVELVRTDKDIIGGYYRLKTHEYLGTAVRLIDRRDWRPSLLEGTIDEAEYISTGCTLVKREVITDMIDVFPGLEYIENLSMRPLWAFYQPFVHFNGDFNEYLSEDWAFCERARQAGHRVWAHGGIRCRHWGKFLYTLDDLEVKEEIERDAATMDSRPD